MSDLAIGLVAEGPTDAIVIEAALKHIVSQKFTFSTIQPDSDSVALKNGSGWGGVYKWCRKTTTPEPENLLSIPTLSRFNILIIHIDADVASFTYESANIHDPIDTSLPCEMPCPPATSSIDNLSNVVRNWLSPVSICPKSVLCIPSKSIEAWAAIALYGETDPLLAENIECKYDIVQYLYAKPEKTKLVEKSNRVLKKRQARYQNRSEEISHRWEFVTQKCPSALLFTEDVLRAVSA